MARTAEEFEERILDVDVTEEMEFSLLEYAYSVIYARALPDARDGLKPIQRRILFSMDDMGVRPREGCVKRAHVVGQAMGVLHSHGNNAIYDALVRMARPQAMRLSLASGHGNFESLDAGPAVMRYTECRMVRSVVAITAGLDESVVDFRSSYDGKGTEPEVLPAALPNLLVNGASGVAAGMATNIAPHNFREVVSALKALLRDREVSLRGLVRHLPGPDFSNGRRIIGLEGIRDAYATGRGSLKVRAGTSIERISAHRRGIVITELPYLVGPKRIIEQIKKGIDSRKLVGIAGVKGLAGLASGTKLVVEVKSGINPEALLEQLYQVAELEDTFTINAMTLVEGQPRTPTLKQLLEVYLDHQLQMTVRRVWHRLSRTQERLHLARGLLLAIVDIDEVIAIVRSSEDTAEARTRLMGAFDLDEVQASRILDTQLRRLAKYSTLELNVEADEPTARIDELQRTLDDDTVLNALVSSELGEMAERFETPCRTVLLVADGVVRSAAPLEVPDRPCQVLLFTTGHTARTDSTAPLPVMGPRAAHDVIVATIRVTSRAEFGVTIDTGRLLRARAIELPTVPLTATTPNPQSGPESRELWPLEQGERVVGLTSLDPGGPDLALGTLQGAVERVSPEVIGKGLRDVIHFERDDEIVGTVKLGSPNLALTISDAQLLYFSADLVRPQGRLGGGVVGVRLSKDAKVLFFGGVDPTTNLVVTTVGAPDSLFGYTTAGAKVTPLTEYPTKNRVTGGVRCQRFLKGETAFIAATINGFVTAAASNGTSIVLPEPTPKHDGSGIPLKGVVEALRARCTPEVVELIP